MSRSWLDYVEQRDRGRALADPSYREALERTYVGQRAKLAATFADLVDALAAASPFFRRRIGR